MNQWERVALTDICKPKQWSTISKSELQDRGYPVFGANGKIGFYSQYNHEKATILVGCRGSCGALNISEPFSYVTGNAMALDAVEEKVIDLKFLFHQLTWRGLKDAISGGVQPQITRESLERVHIIVPSLSEQRRITALLEKADRLRRTRRYAAQLSDTFLQAIFLRMFGDPVRNPMGWDDGELEALCVEIVDCPHATPKYAEGVTDYACIRSSDIQNGFLDWSTTLYVEESEYLKRIERTIPVANDVVYCREGARFGNAARVPKGRKVCLGQRTMLFRANPDAATCEFIWAFLESKSTHQQAVLWAGGSASPHVNVQDIKAFKTMIPQLALQQKFARVVQQFERVSAQQREAERQAEHLFQTLLHSAFSGRV